MEHRTNARRRAAALILSVGVVAGCSGSGNSTSVGGTARAATPAGRNASSKSVVAKSTTPTTAADPTETFYERLNGGPTDPATQLRQFENDVAVCMRARGWDYTPYDNSQNPTPTATRSGDDEKFREDWGYGISTIIGHESENPYGVVWSGGKNAVDPNANYVAHLSTADRAAYNEDLVGPTSDSSRGDHRAL